MQSIANILTLWLRTWKVTLITVASILIPGIYGRQWLAFLVTLALWAFCVWTPLVKGEDTSGDVGLGFVVLGIFQVLPVALLTALAVSLARWAA